MKLIGNKTREYKGKQYMKFSVVIPNKDIKKLEWLEGENLETEIVEGNLLIKKIKNHNSS